MKLIALDLSLTRTGIAEVTTGEDLATYSIETKLRGAERLAWIRDVVVHRATVNQPADVVTLEGYSFNSRNSQAHALGELGGVVRVGLHEARLAVAEIAPKSLKKYATGAGNAGKDQVMAAAARRADRDFACSDEADAFWLLQMAMARYCPEHGAFLVLPAKHQEALRAIEWPELKEKETAG